MPGRVQRIDSVLKELQTGDLKLRVRALEVERAARRSSILQVRLLRDCLHRAWECPLLLTFACRIVVRDRQGRAILASFSSVLYQR